MTVPGIIALLVLIGVALVGGFSRFTHGKHTPGFYAYQLDRAPDNAATRFLPYLDFAMAALLVLPSTRGAGAVLFSVMQFIGVVVRTREDKNAAPDLALCLCAVFLMLDCLLSG